MLLCLLPTLNIKDYDKTISSYSIIWHPLNSFFGSIETLAFFMCHYDNGYLIVRCKHFCAIITVLMTLYSTLTCWRCGCYQISFTCCSCKCWFATIYKSHKHIWLVTFWTFKFEEKGSWAISHLGRGSLRSIILIKPYISPASWFLR